MLIFLMETVNFKKYSLLSRNSKKCFSEKKFSIINLNYWKLNNNTENKAIKYIFKK